MKEQLIPSQFFDFKEKFQFGAKGRYQDLFFAKLIQGQVFSQIELPDAYIIGQRTGSGLKEPPNTDL
jgi:hypothetical protein